MFRHFCYLVLYSFYCAMYVSKIQTDSLFRNYYKRMKYVRRENLFVQEEEHFRIKQASTYYDTKIKINMYIYKCLLHQYYIARQLCLHTYIYVYCILESICYFILIFMSEISLLHSYHFITAASIGFKSSTISPASFLFSGMNYRYKVATLHSYRYCAKCV